MVVLGPVSDECCFSNYVLVTSYFLGENSLYLDRF